MKQCLIERIKREFGIAITILLLFLLLPVLSYSQDRLFRGVLTDENDDPIPGVNIIIKGTQTGTLTNVYGEYSLKVPLGATLVISYIGFISEEVVVTEANSEPIGREESKKTTQPYTPAGNSTLQSTRIKNKSVARLSSDGPIYKLKRPTTQFWGLSDQNNSTILTPYSIKYLNPFVARLKYGQQGKNGVLLVENRKTKLYPVIQYNTSFTIDEVNKLPALQSKYAQGRPQDGAEVWRGPETGEVFSWGPPLANLEYDGSAYPYHDNGMLRLKGTGNGEPATSYDPLQYFQNGFTADNEISIKRAGETSYFASFHRKDSRYIFPGSGLSSNNVSLKVNTNFFHNFRINYSISYLKSNSQLMNNWNYPRIISSVYLTPPSFDNLNGYTRREALKKEDAYLLPDQSVRSSAPKYTDNPLWLSNLLPDNDEFQKFISILKVNYDVDNFSFNYVIGFDNQKNESRVGLPVSSAEFLTGALTHRNEGSKNIKSSFSGTFKPNMDNYDHKLSILFNHDFNAMHNTLDRADGFGFSNSNNLELANSEDLQQQSFSKTRNLHQFKLSTQYQYRYIVDAEIANNIYTSNTAETNYFLPHMGAGFRFSELGLFRYSNVLTHGRYTLAYSKSVREAPLIYSRWHFNSLTTSPEKYLSYYENAELTHEDNLVPEIMHKFETAINLEFFQRLGLEVSYYVNRTNNFISPVPDVPKFFLKNTADIVTKGFDVGLSYRTLYRDNIRLHTQIHFSTYRPVVEKVNTFTKVVPLAGFYNIFTVLAEGMPYGTIFGTFYQRNEKGEMIIDATGFPLVDDIKAIGNPNPDWIGGISNEVYYRAFTLSFVAEYIKGGERWNGTKNALNFFGVSATTENERNTRNFIFPGVLENGTVNNKAVDFANPAKELFENRWVRYGIAGVAEDAIEDASHFRLTELNFHTSFRLTKTM